MLPEIPDGSNGETIQSVDRTLRIIESIQASNGASLGELTDEFDIAKSTVHRHLNTLKKHGYVVKEGDEYHVGLRFLDPALHAKHRKKEYQVIESKVEYLAEETGERAQFITEENGLGIHVHSNVGENGIQSESRVGKVVYLHATSVGKSILAHLPSERVEAVIEKHGLPRLTENTVTDRDELYDVLEAIRDRGYAYNEAERRTGMMAIGAPVVRSDGRILGGISVTGPVRRMRSDHEDDLPDLLLDLTDEIRLRLEYPQH